MTTQVFNMTDTWTDVGTVWNAWKMTITDTAYDPTSLMIDFSTTVAGGYFKVDVNGNIDLSGYIDLKPLASVPWKEGRMGYSSVSKGFVVYNGEADITGNLMEEEWAAVWNATGVQIDDGTPVYVTGVSGGLPTVAPAIANGQRVIGIATHNIGDGERGYVTRSGKLTGPDFTSYSNGDILYLSPTVAGDMTATEPPYPAKVIELGVVIDNSNPGTMLIDIEHAASRTYISKSYTFASRSAASGEYYQGGFYDYPVAEASLSQASPTVVWGVANHPYAAHAFIVSGGAGATDGSDLVLTVSGTSITDAGVRTPADTEVVCADCLPGGAATDAYFETTKKWLGQVTYTLTSTGGTAFSFNFNYGYSKYEDFNNLNFTIVGVESVGLCNATDTGVEIELIHHNNAGWVWSAAAFQAGNAPIATMNTDHGTEQDIAGGEQFAWKRANLSIPVIGSGLEGAIVRVTTGVNNSISFMDTHLKVTIP